MKRKMTHRVLFVVFAAVLAGSGCGDRPEQMETPVPQGGSGVAAEAAQRAAAEWPAAGPVNVQRSREVDFTGDGTPERVLVSAHGERYDSLAIAVTVASAAGDTLWHEAWTSRYYFVYDPLEGKADSTVKRIVTAHVDTLLADNRLAMQGGLPAPVNQGTGDRRAQMQEALRYSLAELDYRRSAGLRPSVATPPDAHSRIDANSVDMERVDAVLDDLLSRPSFMYFAGGEATYVIAWSARENAFVRIYACC